MKTLALALLLSCGGPALAQSPSWTHPQPPATAKVIRQMRSHLRHLGPEASLDLREFATG